MKKLLLTIGIALGILLIFYIAAPSNKPSQWVIEVPPPSNSNLTPDEIAIENALIFWTSEIENIQPDTIRIQP